MHISLCYNVVFWWSQKQVTISSKYDNKSTFLLITTLYMANEIYRELGIKDQTNNNVPSLLWPIMKPSYHKLLLFSARHAHANIEASLCNGEQCRIWLSASSPSGCTSGQRTCKDHKFADLLVDDDDDDDGVDYYYFGLCCSPSLPWMMCVICHHKAVKYM